MYILSSITFGCVCLYLVSAATVLPESWKICKKSDKKLNECLKSSIQTVVRELKTGNSKFGLPPTEPLLIEEVVLHQGNGQAVGLDLTFRKLKMYGLSRVVVDKVSARYDKDQLSADFHIDGDFRIESDYTAKGRVLVLPINGAGKNVLKFDNLKGKLDMKFNKIKKGADTYYNVNKCDIMLDTSRLHLDFKRSSSVNEGLGQNLNTVLNENWKEILTDLKPAISKAFGAAFKDLANRVFSKVPLDKVMPA
ncbi:protein takeout-like [Rhodnius prolixus]|uniref:Putative odorant binding protein n=1 Tax=Rhodnius prolixus TaxID=13249 RepID=R4G3U8_RHOPR